MRLALVLVSVVASAVVSDASLVAAEVKPAPVVKPAPIVKPAVTTAAGPNAPGASEWEPVRVALANDEPTAQTQLLALIKRYPAWADGTKALAKILLDQGKTAEALTAAKRASQLAPNDDQALRIQVRALADLGRKAEVYALVDSTATKDPTGWIRYDAGLAAVGFNDAPKAEALLKEAKSRAGAKVPADFLFLESRVAILTRDFARAELALSSATTQQADFWDGWYELGRVRLVLADNDHAQRATWIDKARAAFSAVCKGVPDDANGHIGLGRAQLEEAKLLLAVNQNDQAGGKLREAVTHLELALTKAPDSAEAYVLLGDANVRLEQWAAAATALQRAKTLGAKDRSLTFNLAIALQQTGKNDEAQALLKSVTAASPAEEVTIGMGAYRSRNWLVAVQVLESAVDGLEDGAAKGATWRYIGHAYGHIADAKSGDAQNAALDAAASAYRKAGYLLDFDARRAYVSSEALRSPEHAYAAALQAIRWDALNVSAWGLAIGNYGLAKTGGQGLGGMANRAPLHLALWSALVLIPLVFFALGLLRRNKNSSGPQSPVTPRAPRPSKPATTSVQPGPARPPTRGPGPGTGTRPPLPRQPARPTPRPEIGGKDETDEITNPAPRVKQKAETVAMYAPRQKNAEKPGNQPLVKPGLRRPSQIIPPSAADQTMVPSASPDSSVQALERRRT